MNNRPALFFLIIALTSCTYNNVIDPQKKEAEQHGAEKWQLIQMSGSMANVPPSTGSNMTWQEWYVFNPDQSFTKTRVQNNITSVANGTSALVTFSHEQYLELSYPSKNDLVSNCTGDAKELLKINSDNELAGTWLMCDGPGLLYQKVKSCEGSDLP